VNEDPDVVLVPALDAGVQHAVARVYAAAFSEAPYREGPGEVIGFARRLPLDAGVPGFRLAVATDDGEVVGFAYGYDLPGPGEWLEWIADHLGERSAVWLTDGFWFVELAVLPSRRRCGIGRRLHDTVVGATDRRRGLLTAHARATAARRLYRTSGWLTLVNPYPIPGVADPYVLMGNPDLRVGR
jgi:GNAT superfamily N-acetyltransferase